MDKPSVYIGMPIYNRVVDFEIMTMLYQMAAEGNYRLMLDTISGPYIDTNRNRMIKHFLGTNFEWIYFWDTDVVVFDSKFLTKLIETSKKLNAPVVGMPYLIKGAHNLYAVVSGNEEKMVNYKVGELVEPQLVFAISGGSMLIHRSVLEEMEDPYFEINPLAGGREMPEDFYLCNKAHKLGYNVAVDTRIDNYHFAPMAWVHSYSGNEKINIEKRFERDSKSNFNNETMKKKKK